MIQTTIGQRIAGRRKMQNLSQEALAEQLHVSRQAVSKWEADAAIPEIDKLISLAKVFGVSVGWLLGTESDPNFDPSTGLSDAQLKMVEELVARSRPMPKWVRWATILLIFSMLISAVAIDIRYQGKLDVLKKENADTLLQLSALSEDNEKLQTQIDGMNALLKEQAQTGKLLSWFQILPMVEQDLTTVKIQFYCVPKAMPEDAQAYILISNPAAGVSKRLTCTKMGEMFFVQTKVPVADNYQYSYLLVSKGGFQEQIIIGEGSPAEYFSDFRTYLHFRGDPAAEMRTSWDSGDRLYTYTTPIYTPLHVISDDPGIGYQDVLLTLKHNGQVIWERSYRDSLLEHAGVHMRSEEPWMPAIRVQLPELAKGDTLVLEATAKYYGGQTMTSVLETLTVTD